jgi:hypothetical protein
LPAARLLHSPFSACPTATAGYDQRWLDFQHEIGLRHHRTKKNQTDGAQTPEIIHRRCVLALTYPILATLKPFLAEDHSSEEVDKVHQAWTKLVLLPVILWSLPTCEKESFRTKPEKVFPCVTKARILLLHVSRRGLKPRPRPDFDSGLFPFVSFMTA